MKERNVGMIRICQECFRDINTKFSPELYEIVLPTMYWFMPRFISFEVESGGDSVFWTNILGFKVT